MKLKISWPTGIILAIAAFVIFILSFVYLSFTPKYGHDLVSEDYYKDELNYQQEINKENKGILLKENISLKKVSNGLQITFPSEFDFNSISGIIYFQRLSNGKIDFQLPIELESHQLLITQDQLVDGRWDVKIEWEVNIAKYLFKEKIIY